MAPSPDSYEACELQWKIYTKTGNQRMQAKLYQEARQDYHQALELAYKLLEEARHYAGCPDAIHPYVISCHNLADSWLSLGNAQQAEIVRQQAFERVTEIMTDEDLPKPLRLQAFKALRVVSVEIDCFYRNLNQIDRAEETTGRAIAIAQDFMAQFDFSEAVNREDCY
jgi:tetratricopeptide (TPR) repeat protein